MPTPPRPPALHAPAPASAVRRSTGTSAASCSIDHRPRIAPIHLQPLPHHRLRIVRARHPLRADRSAPLGVLAQVRQRVRLVLEGVGIRAAVLAHPARPHPPHQLLVGHLDLDADHRAARRGNLIQRAGLRRGARKPVEHEPGDRIRTRQPLADDPDHQVVADQLAAFHHGLHLPAEFRPAVHRLAENVARRDLGNPELACETFRLRALPRSRRAQHHQVESHVSRAVPGFASSS